MPLVERDRELGLLESAVGRLGDGGRVALVAADAGGGKSMLVESLLAALPAGVRVRRGWCDGISTPRPLGPFVDMAGPAFAAEVAAAPSRTAVLGLVEGLAASSAPTVMVVEDLHWADEATVDAVRFLARRIGRTRTLLVLTCRSDGIDAASAVGPLYAELATSPGAERLELAPLTIAGVAAVLGPGRGDAAAVHALTAGNPFFVAELAVAPPGALPAGVRAAVLARVAALSLSAREVLEAAAVVGPRAELALVDALADGHGAGIDEAAACGFVTAGLGAIAFRHEIARRAIEERLPPSRRAALHARALRQLERSGRPVAVTRLVRHAEEAGDLEALARHAARAAAEASAARAHREAAAQYLRALEAGPPAGDVQELWRRRSYQCYLTGQTGDALAAIEQAAALAQADGDAVATGACLRWIGRLRWFLGDGHGARRAVDDAIALLRDAGDPLELAWAYSARSQLAMLAHESADAERLGALALATAGPDAPPDLRSHALNNIGSARAMRGDVDGGERLLVEALGLAQADGTEEHAARVYCNLGSNALLVRQVDRAGRWLDEGVAFTGSRDLDAWTTYLVGWRAWLALERGRLDDALADASDVLASPRCPPVAQVAPLAALGLVRARRGLPDAGQPIAEALAIARTSGETQRLVIAVAAVAELAWLGEADAPLADLADAIAIARRVADRVAVGVLAVWQARLGGAAPEPAEVPPPYDADAIARAAAWRAAGLPYEEALALVDAGDERSLRGAAALLDQLGAPRAAAVARRRLRERGAPVPAGPRRATRANPAGLTARELEVLAELRDGASDAEIAAALTISVRTAGHHVSAILRKLDVPTRARAAAAAGALLGGAGGAASQDR